MTKSKEKTKRKLPIRSLSAVVGTIAAALLYREVPRHEGVEHMAYRDIAGVWTICAGDTNNVRPGQVETKEGCERRLTEQLIAHAEPVLACVPTLREPGRDYQRAAAVSLAYNIGTAAYCRSTSAARFRARDFKGGCNAMTLFNRAGGKIVTGLVRRREAERAICLTGLE